MRDGKRRRHITTHTHSTVGWLAAMTDGGVQFMGVAMETSISATLSSSTLHKPRYRKAHTHSAEECSVGSRNILLGVYDLLLLHKSVSSGSRLISSV